MNAWKQRTNAGGKLSKVLQAKKKNALWEGSKTEISLSEHIYAWRQ